MSLNAPTAAEEQATQPSIVRQQAAERGCGARPEVAALQCEAFQHSAAAGEGLAEHFHGRITPAQAV